MNSFSASREGFFCTGFVLGAIFAYSGVIGFAGGVIVGAVLANYIMKEKDREWIEPDRPTGNPFTSTINFLKRYYRPA